MSAVTAVSRNNFCTSTQMKKQPVKTCRPIWKKTSPFAPLFFRFESVLTLWYVFWNILRGVKLSTPDQYRTTQTAADIHLMVHQVAWKKGVLTSKCFLVLVECQRISLFDRTVWQSSQAVVDRMNLIVSRQQRSPPKECYWCCTLQLNRHLWMWCIITAAYKGMGFGISWCHSGLLQDGNPVAKWCFFSIAGPKSPCLWMKTSDCGASKPGDFGELMKKECSEKGLKSYFQPKTIFYCFHCGLLSSVKLLQQKGPRTRQLFW